MAIDHSPDAVHPGPFQVGDWLVEPRACRLSRGGATVKLRPQLVGLLVCLARRPGEILLKEEILADVWPGQYVAESGLSRCVAELRQVLGDDTQEPRFIETYPKRGYRLIAPVVRLDRAPSAAEVTSRDGHAPGGRRAGVWLGIAAGLLTLVTAAVVVVTRSPASALTERDTVLLADVRNATGDRVFDDTLRLALAVNLGQAPFLRLLPDDVVHAALIRAGRAADERATGALALDVCRREGAALVLSGSIAPLGSRYVVGLEAIACGSGEEVGRALEQARSKEDVLPALDRAATRLRKALGESRVSLTQHNVPLARATTPSLDALKALTLGDQYRDHARPAEAFAMYRQATELDPGFALAWARRGAAAINLQRAGEAVPALRKAYELRDRVTAPERFYIAAHYYRIVEADPQKSIEVYRAWKQMYPGSAVPPTNLASVLSSWMGDYGTAVPEAREAVRLTPYSSLASSNLVMACLGDGRVAEARAALAEAIARGQDDRLVHEQALNLALFDRDASALAREFSRAAGEPAGALQILSVRAAAAMAAGQLRDARRLWADASTRAVEIGSPELSARVRLDHAEAEALLGETASARRAIESALVLDTGTLTRLSASIAFSLAGDPARSAALLETVEREQLDDPLISKIWLPVARSLSAAGRGEAANALAVLLPVRPFERGAAFNLIPLGAHAIAAQAAGRHADAAAALKDLTRQRAVFPVSPWVPFAQVTLARVLGAQGDAPGSMAAYDAFLELWSGADADAPLLVAARRERAAVARQ